MPKIASPPINSRRQTQSAQKLPTNPPKKKFEIMKRSSPLSSNCQCLGATGKRTRSSKPAFMTNNKALMKPMMKLEAQTPVLQRFWNITRVNSTGRLVKRISAVGPTSTRIKRMPFDEVVSYLREQNVIAATKACLQRIHLLTSVTTFRHGLMIKFFFSTKIHFFSTSI